MTLEIKTANVTPIRNGYTHLIRRFGDKPATRYQEATYDVQGTANFHYRPLWDPTHELNDASRTALVMNDWYSFKDPRQFYYGTYVFQRAKMQDKAENNYEFFEHRNLARHLSEDATSRIIRFLVPLRHYEQAANLNNMFGTAYGYGTALTQALLYNAMDRLGIAQYLSRIGLLLDGNSAEALTVAKNNWLTDPCWQGLRALCEETLVTQDWFELFIAQDVVMDKLVYDLFYRQLDELLVSQGASDVAMLTEFMRDWHQDTTRWVDSVIKIATAESEHNQALLNRWVVNWREKTTTALRPLAEAMFNTQAMDTALDALNADLAKSGLRI